MLHNDKLPFMFLFLQDDNAEDLAETFGNQLGLTKAFRKALHIRLKQEMDNFLNS